MMISPSGVQSLGELLAVLQPNRHPQLFGLLVALIDHGKQVLRVSAVIMTRPKDGPALPEIRGTGDSVRQAIDKAEHRAVHRSLASIHETASRYAEQLDEIGPRLGGQLTATVDQLETQYEAYLQDRTYENAVLVMLGALSFHEAFASASAAAQAVVRATPFAEPAPPGKQVLSVRLDAPEDAMSVALNLRAVGVIYVELSEVMDVSLQDYPLVLRGYSPGTQWFEFLGHPGVLAILVPTLTAGLHWLARNSGKEGKRDSLAKDVRVADSVLSLRSSLKQAGRNTDAMDDHIDKAAVKIAKALDSMIVDEERVTKVGIEIVLAETSAEPPQLPGKRRMLKPGEEN